MRHHLTDDPLPSDALLFVPLGGCQEFGINLNAYGYGGKWIVVDCGIGFAGDQYAGVDLLLPDPIFLEERRDDLLGIFVTHVHEDHIGAIPYLWERLKCPVYCTPFAASFLRRKCAEFDGVRKMTIHEISPDQVISVGDFKIGVIGVTHSTPSTVSFTIDTPAGLVVHGNEWNLDPTPKAALPTNREAFKGAGRQGVLAYIGDSTNAPYDGTPIGETAVQEGLEAVLSRAPARVVVTMFASNVGRLISIARAAARTGRQVALAGRSLFNFAGIAADHHLLRDMPPFLDTAEAAMLPANRVVYIVTGSQGEPRAALSRIARGDYRDITLGAGDTVVFSSRAIPGNDRAISKVKSDLLAAGLTVIDTDTAPNIHATGHPYRDEINQMLDWVRPRIVVPIHGERLHLEAQADLARAKQVPHVIVPENGSVICLDHDHPGIIGKVSVGVLAVEPVRVVATHHPAIQERRQLNTAGALHATVVINKKGQLVVPPTVSGVGLFDPQDPDDAVVVQAVIKELTDTLRDLHDAGRIHDMTYAREELRLSARRAVATALGFKPKTTLHLVQVP